VDAAQSDPYIALIERMGTINKRFESPSWIGGVGLEGNFSLLFRAIDNKNGRRPVALKFFHPNWSRDAYRRDCFSREAQLLTELQGADNILQILETEQILTIDAVASGVSVPIQLPFYATELANGSLLEYTYGSSNNPRDSLILFREVCKGLQRLHSKRITHRDLKPGNCLRFQGKVAKLADFGTALHIDGQRIGPGARYDVPVGDARYSAIELFCGMGRYPEFFLGADIFALGAILFELFTRQVLTELFFDRQFQDYLLRFFHGVLEDHRKPLLDSMLPGIAARLPDMPPSELLRPSIRDRVRLLYMALADLDYRRRSKVSFGWIFDQVNICLTILDHEKKYHEMLELRRAWKS
jgi:serine/threonine protein kinase